MRHRLPILAAPAAAACLAAGAVALADAIPWLAIAAAGAAAIVAVAAGILASHHFDALGRLANILAGLAAGSGMRPPAPMLEGAGEEVASAYQAGLDLHAAREAVRRQSGLAANGGRLGQILAALPQPVLVLTESGLVSLTNGAARRLFGSRAVLPGTSAFDALDRDQVGVAVALARGAGRPMEAMVETVDGRPLRVQVTALERGDGAVLSFAPAGAWERGLDHALELHDRPPPAGPVDSRTPLAGLPIVVLDTETTGLDPATDRIVAVGAVRLHGSHLYRGITFDRLVHPGVPIPPRAAAVHGIDDTMVAEAPPFAAVLPAILEFADGCVIVGHNIGFDLAIIEAEAARSGVSWHRPPSLCLFQLADALDPARTDLDLEALAERLAVTVTGRHTALGDALVTAEIYLRLLPRLAALGIADWGGVTALAMRARRVHRLQAGAGW